jgi:hypothetical protein
MTTPTSLTRIDLTVTGVTGAVLAGVALRYGVPTWLLPLGAAPLLTVLLVVWLAGYHDSTYARTRRDIDAAIFDATEAAHANRPAGQPAPSRAGAR